MYENVSKPNPNLAFSMQIHSIRVQTPDIVHHNQWEKQPIECDENVELACDNTRNYWTQTINIIQHKIIRVRFQCMSNVSVWSNAIVCISCRSHKQNWFWTIRNFCRRSASIQPRSGSHQIAHTHSPPGQKYRSGKRNTCSAREYAIEVYSESEEQYCGVAGDMKRMQGRNLV